MPARDDTPDRRVTVVVASRDRRLTLLRSIPRHLELPERPQVIVVDDGSSDGTAETLRQAHPEVEVLEPGAVGVSVARNLGVQAAGSAFVAFCDDDSWFAPGSLARACELLDRHPRLALVNARVLVGDAEREDPLCDEMARSPLPRGTEQPGAPLLGFIACAVVLRRDAFLAVGGFEPRLGVGGEEELLGWELAAAGWEMSYVPEVVAHHHPPKVAGGRPERRELGIRNTLWTTWLRRPARPAAVRTVRDLRRFPRDRVTVRAVTRAVGGAPWVLRHRRVVPPHVERMIRSLEEQQLSSRSRRYV